MMALQGYVDDFQVFGSDFPTEDGTAVRDYIHVSDLADAHVAALRRLLDGHAGGAYNLGTGQGYSVKDVLRAIESETGEVLPAAKGPRREGDPAILIADPTQAQQILGFRPRYSDLETIVRTAWAWHRCKHPRRNAAARP
jgi:UDP-glucose 4-epimerase